MFERVQRHTLLTGRDIRRQFRGGCMRCEHDTASAPGCSGPGSARSSEDRCRQLLLCNERKLSEVCYSLSKHTYKDWQQTSKGYRYTDRRREGSWIGAYSLDTPIIERSMEYPCTNNRLNTFEAIRFLVLPWQEVWHPTAQKYLGIVGGRFFGTRLRPPQTRLTMT